MLDRLRADLPDADAIEALEKEASELSLEELTKRVNNYDQYLKQVEKSGSLIQIKELFLPSAPVILNAHLSRAEVAYAVAKRVLERRTEKTYSTFWLVL